jgi:hypothetical protein
MDVNNLTVVLLAGDPKCLNPIPPVKSERYLTRAFRAAMGLGCPIVLVNHPDVTLMRGSSIVTRVPAGRNVFESLVAGLDVCHTEYALVVATDLPKIHTGAMKDFIKQAGGKDADVSIALADLTACQALDHNTSRPIPLDGRYYKFGSVFLVKCQARDRILRVYQEIHGLRKQIIRLALRFVSARSLFQALRFALTYKVKSLAKSRIALSCSQVEDLVWQQVGVRVRGIVASPALAIDHD